jgi:hypothetical protein
LRRLVRFFCNPVPSRISDFYRFDDCSFNFFSGFMNAFIISTALMHPPSWPPEILVFEVFLVLSYALFSLSLKYSTLTCDGEDPCSML